MTEECEYLKEVKDSVSEIISNQNLVIENGGRTLIDLSDLEFLDYDEHVRLIGDLEYELCLILRKNYLKKHPELDEVIKEIAVKVLNKENS